MDEGIQAEERARQIARLVKLGFARRLGLPESEYAGRFPSAESMRRPPAARFDLLAAVDPLVDLAFQHQAAGIKEAISSAQLHTAGSPPRSPYFIWACASRQWSGLSMTEARKEFSGDEVGCSQHEITALFLHHPELFQGRGLDSELTAHADKPEYHSTLIWVQDPPELALHHENDRTIGLGVLTRAR